MTRAQTHQRLQETAVRLFAERGYDGVTVEEIARAAGVSHMTFFRHYPTKVSVLLDDPYDPVIGEMVERTDPQLTPLERIQHGMVAAWGSKAEPDAQLIRTRLRILAGREDLVAHAWANNRRTEAVVVAALVSTGVAPLEARVAAGAVTGALTAALIDWALDDDAGPLAERVFTALELLTSPARAVARG